MEKKRIKKVKKKNGIFLLVSVSGLITKAFFFQDSGNPSLYRQEEKCLASGNKKPFKY